jgi:hypothetical protein
MRPFYLVPAICLLLCGCSAKVNVEDARKAVDQFHQRMSAGEYEVIYDSSTNAFKAAGSKDQMQGFFKRVNRKMGVCTEATQKSWNINATTSGTFVQLSYSRRCANGDLQEHFVWKMENGKPTLQGYNVNSPLLLAD